MSTLKVAGLQGLSASSDAITLANDGSCTANITNNLSNRNLIINGSQIIDQRNSGSAVTVSNATATYVTDRFKFYEDTDGVISVQQSTTAPDGFTKSLKVDCTTVDTSLAANQRLICAHRIEGNNIAHLGFGSSAAKTITLSFYVRSNLTGTFGGVIKNSGDNRVYIFSYTISSADTWERKTITIAGDTSGTWLTTNGTGITINWGLALGSDWTGTAGSWGTSDKHGVTGQLNLLSSTDNEWLLTGVQLEVGSVATDFEHRSFAQELLLCQRYYQKSFEQGTTPAHGVSKGIYQYIKPYTSDYMAGLCHYLPVEMRSTPTVVTYTLSGVTNSTDNRFNHYNNSSWGVCALSLEGNSNPRTLAFGGQTGSSSTVLIQYNFTASAEL